MYIHTVLKCLTIGLLSSAVSRHYGCISVPLFRWDSCGDREEGNAETQDTDPGPDPEVGNGLLG